MNPFEHELLSSVAGAILRLLPGASVSIRASDYGTGALEVVVFRIGPERTAELIPDGHGWFVVEGDASTLAHVPLEARRVEPLGVAPTASADEVARAFAGALQRSVAGAPGAADAGLVAALGGGSVIRDAVLTGASVPAPGQPAPFSAQPVPFSAPPGSFTAPLPRRRSLATVAVVLAALVLLGVGTLGGITFVAIFGPGSSSAASGSGSGARSGSGSGSSGDGVTGTTAVSTLRPGSCFDIADAQDASGRILPKKCTESHDSEIFAVVTVPESSDLSGRSTYDQADLLCLPKYAPYVGVDYNDSGDDFDVLTPSADRFDAGDRTAYCYITLPAPTTHSAKGSGD